jgi:hypothetical protein
MNDEIKKLFEKTLKENEILYYHYNDHTIFMFTVRDFLEELSQQLSVSYWDSDNLNEVEDKINEVIKII